MQYVTTFLQWLIQYAVGSGFWHFAAVLLIVNTITGFTTIVRISRTTNNKSE